MFKYLAIDEPAYMAMKNGGPAPTTDEEMGMTDRIVYARNATYANACDTMADKLREIAAMDHIIRSNMSVLYEAAAIIFTHAKRAQYPQEISIRISGRVHTVRETP